MIRALSIADISKLEESHQQLFGQGFNFEEYMNNESFNYGIVLEVDGCVAGYLMAQIIYEQTDLFYVTVLPEHQLKGYASQLMKVYFDTCEKKCVEQYSLEVRCSNVAAISLYKKFGYKAVQVRKQYYDDKEDALLMVRE